MREFKRNRSGQALILAALAIALIISSTIVYVYEMSQASSSDHPFSPKDYVRVVKLGSRNLVVGLLANISRGGENRTLETNLERWGSFVEKEYYFGECSLHIELCEDTPYSSGLWMLWGENGSGVTSAEADFSLNLTSEGTEMTVLYVINVTTSISIDAASEWQSDKHEITVTIFLCNEGAPAFGKNLTVYYEGTGGGWMDAGLLDSYSLTDFGNGTYVAGFSVGPPQTANRSILVECYDRREIYVEATTTCADV